MENTVHFDVLDAICTISKKLKKSQLKLSKLSGIKTKLNLLKGYLNTPDLETLLFVAIFTLKYNFSRTIDLNDITSFFDCEGLDILPYRTDLLNLQEKKYIVIEESRRSVSNKGKKTIYFETNYDVNPFIEYAIFENRPLPENAHNEVEQTNEKFVELISNLLDKNTETEGSFQYHQTQEKIKELEEKHSDLRIIKKAKPILKTIEDRSIFYSVCYAFLQWNENVSLKDTLKSIYPNQRQRIEVANQSRENTHPLFEKELIKFAETNDTFDLQVTLDENGLDIFLDEYTKILRTKNNKDIIESETIAEKTLFFKPDLEKQVNFLTSTLEETSFKNLRASLEKEKFPQGVCALFYGSPGTGKTESVYQLAKTTGRSIVHVDISQSKSMWFGESEKKIKKIFQDYKRLCKECDIKPILLFNEADAIFSKRKEAHNSSVDQTENTMQNIILEEMEKLDGILIATTNLTGNLDAAFERRFLFKIEFEKPTVEAKINIWKSKMPKLSKKNATVLANAYDFSGGEIDNIVRKCIIDEVISGKKATLEDIETLCKQEHIHKQREGNRIGFGT